MSAVNLILSDLFSALADLGALLGHNRFKLNAYTKAARVLRELPRDVSDIPAGELTSVDGIGKGIAERITEYLETGQIGEYIDLLREVPEGVLAMLDIPGLGPKSVATLWHDAGVTSIDELTAFIDSDGLAGLKGFGKKTGENIKKALAFQAQSGGRVLLGQAMAVAEALAEAMRRVEGVQRVEIAGSLRRGQETIGDVDLLAAVDPETDPGPVMQAFVDQPGVTEVLAQGQTKSSVRTEAGLQVDLRVVDPARFGAAWMYFTGSKEHNVKMRERALKQGLSLNEYSLHTKGDANDVTAAETEEAVYAALGLAWVPPTLREDRGELALAEASRTGDDQAAGLPELVQVKDIKAELHTHTTASDGKWSIEELALAAAERGCHTLAVTDHSKSQPQANGLSVARLEKHIVAVREVAKKLKGTITVLAGSEVDILADGTLDYPDELLAELDLVVASPHAALSQEPKKATARLLKAIAHPSVTILGHPTGRLVGTRPGLSPDIDALCQAAADRGVALEINANHHRLDLRDTHARVAIEAGCKLSINTDAHGPGDFRHLRFGVLTAQRAGATKRDVVNAMTKTQLANWIKATRG